MVVILTQRFTRPLLRKACCTFFAWGPLWGCRAGVDLPEPPVEVQGIVEDYESPSGTVQRTFERELIAEVLRRQELVDGSGIAEVVSEVLTRLRDRFEASDLPTSTEQRLDDLPNFDGFVRVDRVCRGWDPAQTSPAADQNGTVSMTATFEQGRLQPVVWGPARQCRGRVELRDGTREVSGYVDGELWVYLNEGLPRDVTEADFILGFDGTLGGQRLQANVSFDLRFVFPQIELRVPVPDGHVIASAGLDGIRIRAANGVFVCTIAPADCSRL
jgi:hypothetical protein